MMRGGREGGREGEMLSAFSLSLSLWLLLCFLERGREEGRKEGLASIAAAAELMLARALTLLPLSGQDSGLEWLADFASSAELRTVGRTGQRRGWTDRSTQVGVPFHAAARRPERRDRFIQMLHEHLKQCSSSLMSVLYESSLQSMYLHEKGFSWVA